MKKGDKVEVVAPGAFRGNKGELHTDYLESFRGYLVRIDGFSTGLLDDLVPFSENELTVIQEASASHE